MNEVTAFLVPEDYKIVTNPAAVSQGVQAIVDAMKGTTSGIIIIKKDDEKKVYIIG